MKMTCAKYIILFVSLHAMDISGQGYPNAGGPNNVDTTTPQNTELCKIPIAVTAPNPINLDPELLQGTWYIYRHLSTATNGINRIYRVSTISKTVMAGQTTGPAATQRTSVSWYPMENDTDCSSMEFLGFTSYSGLQIVDVYRDVRPITTRTYFTLSFDTLQGLLVLYRCEQPNLVESKCDIPIVNVWVRQRPDELSEEKKRDIDALLDALFKPYCLSTAQFPLSQYTKAKSVCPERTPTPEEQRKIEGLRQTKA